MIIPDNIDFKQYLEEGSFLESTDLHWSDPWVDEVKDRIINGKQLKGEQ